MAGPAYTRAIAITRDVKEKETRALWKKDADDANAKIKAGGLPDAEVEKLRDWYSEDPNGLIVAPLDELGAKIDLTAWTAPEPTPGNTADNTWDAVTATVRQWAASFETVI